MLEMRTYTWGETKKDRNWEVFLFPYIVSAQAKLLQKQHATEIKWAQKNRRILLGPFSYIIIIVSSLPKNKKHNKIKNSWQKSIYLSVCIICKKIFCMGHGMHAQPSVSDHYICMPCHANLYLHRYAPPLCIEVWENPKHTHLPFQWTQRVETLRLRPCSTNIHIIDPKSTWVGFKRSKHDSVSQSVRGKFLLYNLINVNQGLNAWSIIP